LRPRLLDHLGRCTLLHALPGRSTGFKHCSGPLSAIRKLLDAGDIQHVRACQILGLPDAPVDDPAACELWHALRDHAAVIGLYDENRLPDALSGAIDRAEKSIWIWSPWVGRRSRQFLPHLRDAAARGVNVRLVTLASDDVNQHMEPFHQEVAAQFPGTIHMDKEHQKIIVIDQRLTFVGSMNVLSHAPHGRLETMTLFKGSAFAQRFLDHERADQLANPPTCAKCGTPVNRVHNLRGRDGYRLHWICRKNRDGVKCDWASPFPDREGTRNQPRLRR
jgi:phosphatidylserine/phosphatidylglycerophosphate/cardiolipin synthase-like enzyme